MLFYANNNNTLTIYHRSEITRPLPPVILKQSQQRNLAYIDISLRRIRTRQRMRAYIKKTLQRTSVDECGLLRLLDSTNICPPPPTPPRLRSPNRLLPPDTLMRFMKSRQEISITTRRSTYQIQLDILRSSPVLMRGLHRRVYEFKKLIGAWSPQKSYYRMVNRG